MKFGYWWTRFTFLVSPSNRKLLKSAQNKITSSSLLEDEKFTDLAYINTSYDPVMLRLYVNASSKWRPSDIMGLPPFPEAPGIKAGITHLTDVHFLIASEMSMLDYDKSQSLGSFLSPESITASREGRKILHYALHHEPDWDLIAMLLRDRGIWDYQLMMDSLEVLKSGGSATLAEGAL